MRFEQKLDGIKTKYTIGSIIEALKQNKEAHIEQYEAAKVEYEKQLLERAKKALKEVKKNRQPEVKMNFGLIAPINKSEEYDKMINIFKQAQKAATKDVVDGELITLDFEQADAIFNDNWDWVASAKLVNSSYMLSR